jgi:hypothetical protein
LNRRQLIIEPGFLQGRQFGAFDLTRPNFNKLSAVAFPAAHGGAHLMSRGEQLQDGVPADKAQSAGDQNGLTGFSPVAKHAKFTPS